MVRMIDRSLGLYRIEVPLPENPLKCLNSYVFAEAERPLIIDTGFNRDECFHALMAGLEKLHVDLAKADLFLTHLHGDHTGLAVKLANRCCTIYMNPKDHRYFEDMRAGIITEYLDAMFLEEGFPPEELRVQQNVNHARLYMAESVYEAIPVEDGALLSLAGRRFRAIETPGHTPGHTCLYLEEEQVMFLGDHVLFDITPNITVWRGMPDSLGSYLKSLDLIENYPVRLALPGHRENDMEFLVRIGELKIHHERRLAETVRIIGAEPGLNAYEIAARMTWAMRGKNWAEFPVGQKWFAMGETLAHLNHLLPEGKIKRKQTDRSSRYYLP